MREAVLSSPTRAHFFFIFLTSSSSHTNHSSTTARGFLLLLIAVVRNSPQEGHPLDNLLLEIKSYKFAQNREFKECMRPAVEVVLDLAGADRGNVSEPVKSLL